MLRKAIEAGKQSVGLAVMLVVLCGTAVQPLLAGNLPWRGDGLLHLYRLTQLERAVRYGAWLPRWLPDMAYGFGFPLFNYYAPLSYYGLLLVRGMGVSAESALLIGYALALFATAGAVFLWTRRLFDSAESALVAAAAAVYAPYLLVNVHHRGALAEVWGITCLALCFWSVTRLVQQADRRSVAAAVLSYTALLLTHNITALVGTPLLGAYALALIFAQSPPLRRSSGVRVGLALALGLGLSAFFWVPALFERDLVQIERLYASANFDFRNNFSSVANLLAWPDSADSAQVNPPLPLSISWPVLLLALLSWRRPAPDAPPLRWLRNTLGGVAILLVLLMLPVSEPLWTRLPLVRFVQFPWRLLGPLSLLLAPLAGLGASRLPLPSAARAPVAVLLITLFAFFWLFPAPLATTLDLSPIGLIDFESESGALGTTSAADYLPRTVQRLPPADALRASYAASAPEYLFDRIDTASLPPDAVATTVEQRFLASTHAVATPVAFEIRFWRFFFPGWQIAVDGARVETRAAGEWGLISAEIPAGRHTVTLTFSDTPLRQAATIISWTSVLLLAVWLGRSQRDTPYPATQRTPRSFYSVALLALLLTGMKWQLDSVDSPFRRAAFDGQRVSDIDITTAVNFGNRLQLLGADLPTASVRADDLLDVDLYWRAMPPNDRDYSVALHLVDDLGRRVGQSDSYHPANFPVSRWQPGEYARDVHRLALRPGAPPGAYTLLVFVYDVATGERLARLNEAGLPDGTTWPLATVTVTAPRQEPTLADLDVGQSSTLTLGALALIGVNPPPPAVSVGNPLPLTLFWRAADQPQRDYVAALTLLADDNTPVAALTFPPGRDGWPTSQWRAGQTVRDERALVVPALRPDGTPLASGTYRLVATLTNADDARQQATIDVATVAVIAPERTFTAPSDVPAVRHALAPGVTLYGFGLSRDEAISTLTLIWQPQATFDRSYTLFVHLLDADDNIVAQVDRLPAAGARPTTGWVPGEFVRDTVTLPLPAATGRYRLAVGLYDAATGERLGDRWVLPESIEVSDGRD